MNKLELTDRADEIYNKLPKKYADIIFNSIIARSIQNGLMAKEASIFLNEEDLEKLLSEIDGVIKVKRLVDRKSLAAPTEKSTTDKYSLFEGFD